MKKKSARRLAIILSLAICLVSVFAFAGCSSKENLATVDGAEITQAQVDELSNFLVLQYGYTFNEMPEDQQTQIKNSMFSFLVEERIVRSQFDSKKVITDDISKTIDDQIAALKENESFKDQIKDLKISDETLKIFYESQYYMQAFEEKNEKDDPVTDEEISKYYEEHAEDFVSPASISLSHILMGTAEHTAEDRAAIEAVLQQIQEGGDFAALATANSTDPGSKDAGGDLGVVVKGQMVEAFETAGFALKNGQLSDIVESDYGFHIIKANSDPAPETPKTLEQATDEVKQILQTENYEKAIDELKKSNKVKYNDKLVQENEDTGEWEIKAKK
jgi:foldase protein PrsA